MNYVSNVDTICILIDIENYIESKNVITLLKMLEEEKEKALLAATNNTQYSHIVTINEMTFQLFPNGTSGYAYILHNNGYEIKISKYGNKIKNFFPIQVRISAEYLWAKGLKYSWNIIYNWLVEIFGNIKEDKVFRVDLATHLSDVDLVLDYENSYKGNFKKSTVNITNNKINAIAFASRKSGIHCRIYNKSLEIQEKNQKLWFRDIWINNNMNIDNVWNIEFELKSKFMREYNINSVRDVLEHLRDLWEYCTKEWLIKIDRTNKRIERCSINKEWLEIQKAYNIFKLNGLIKREIQINADAQAMIPAISGYVTTYGARIGKSNINYVFNDIAIRAQKYFNRKNTNFESEVLNKMPAIYDCEVR